MSYAHLLLAVSFQMMLWPLIMLKYLFDSKLWTDMDQSCVYSHLNYKSFHLMVIYLYIHTTIVYSVNAI